MLRLALCASSLRAYSIQRMTPAMALVLLLVMSFPLWGIFFSLWLAFFFAHKLKAVPPVLRILLCVVSEMVLFWPVEIRGGEGPLFISPWYLAFFIDPSGRSIHMESSGLVLAIYFVTASLLPYLFQIRKVRSLASSFESILDNSWKPFVAAGLIGPLLAGLIASMARTVGYSPSDNLNRAVLGLSVVAVFIGIKRITRTSAPENANGQRQTTDSDA